MSKLDPQYSPLLQGVSSEEEEEEENGVPATESLCGEDEEKKAGLLFPKPYRPHRTKATPRTKPARRAKPLHILFAVTGTILLGLLVALIAGVVSRGTGDLNSKHQKVQKPGIGSTISSHHAPSSLKSPTSTIPTTAPIQHTTTTEETHSTTSKATVGPTEDWQIILNQTGAEASIRTPDIDGDGLPDVLFGLAHSVDLSKVSSLDGANSLKKYCEEKHEPYPCVGFLLALRGYDKKELWRVSTRSEVMFMMCDLDLNGDGANDCVATGRQSSVQAVDLRKGKTLWFADGSEYPNFFKETWNVYQATPLPDVDGDDVPDIVIAHGGDPNINAEIHDRVAGRLILLSGATGRPLGNYLEMPNNKETYMSPVMYTDTDGSQYLLFGSGGETVSGDLMAISLPDLLEATNQEKNIHTQGRYRWKQIHQSKIMVLYEGKTKGVMVPPVIVDMDYDGVNDIVVSVFEGYIVMLDGNTLFPKWKSPFPEMESYSTPAPGYYNDDDVLDFMVHWSMGAWPSYNESRAYIINGKDGSILWEDHRPLYVMSSDLVLRTTEDHKDCFMIKLRGRPTGIGNIVRSEAHGVGVQRNISKRDAPDTEDNDDFHHCEFMLSEYKKNHVTCDDDLRDAGEQVYLMNRDSGSNMTLLHQTQAEKFDYDVTLSSAGKSCVPVHPKTGTRRMCSPIVPESRSTDAVTDVDNDGVLDLITVSILEGRLRDSRFDYVAMRFTTIISRTSINRVLQTSHQNNHPVFAPLESQPWLQYLGSEGSSVYTIH